MLQNDFINRLMSSGISVKSIKNYKSDINHFIAFIKQKFTGSSASINNLSDCVPYLGSSIAIEYKAYMRQSGSALKSTNRRLSTLRKISKYMYEIGATEDDFASSVNNVGAADKLDSELGEFEIILSEFKKTPNSFKILKEHYQKLSF